jgi:DNA polymerase-1
MHILKKYGAKTFDGFEDIALMRYVLTAGLAQPSFDEFLEQTQISGFQKEYTKYLSELSKQQAFSLYYDIELPVTKVLYKMECTGVKIDQSMLASMSAKFDEEIKILEQQIFKCAGTDFNVASPKQLGEILFEKMKLPSSKTSAKTKVYSTSAEVLEQLSEAGFEIADLLLRWREITKLKNTYTDSLPKKINPVTSRVHTHFVQNLTTTGRLSSQDPNLQNIPIRSKEGAMIREAFVAPEGSMIISADYSQIELRLLADVANVLPLKRAFLNGEDIHAATAAQVFGMDKAEVTSELRRKAKAVNFGIIYGISSFGLAKQLQITRKEAAEIQERYFKEYPGIKKYMDDTKEFVKTHGYVQNMFGRKCHLPLIHDKNFASRSFAERAAINAPLQGGNADIIKLAMIEIHKQFCDNKMNTKIILQVHDELVFEAPNEELEKAKTIIRNAMESVVNLSIPLTVDITSGKNWGK